MNNRAEVHDFLTTRRAKITPEQAGLPAAGQRRVPGLRRSEVAALAGMSVDPHDKGLHDLVGELSTRSEDFRRRWGAHNVRIHGTGRKTFHHQVVGDLELAYETMDLRAEDGIGMTIYAAEPDSSTAQALTLLASWAATNESAPAASQR